MEKEDYVHTKNMKFYKRDRKLMVNKEHYEPTFNASGVDELRENPNTRKMLKEYRIFDQGPDDEEEYAAA